MRVHFLVHAPDGLPEVDNAELEREVVQLARTWDDALRDALAERFGARPRRGCCGRSGPRTCPSTTRATRRRTTGATGHRAARAAGRGRAVPGLAAAAARSHTRVALYKRGPKIELGDALPMLEDLGLRVIEEISTRLVGDDETWVQEFRVLGPDGGPLDIDALGDRVAELLAAVHRGDAETDNLNRLVITAGLDRRQVAILRAYRKYRQRVGSRFTESYQNDVLVANSAVTAKLVRYFELRFDPELETDEAAEAALRDEILADLDEVASLDHDRILRNQLTVIDATLRTNAYNADREALAFKLRSRRRAGDAAAGAVRRDLRLLARGRGHPPARRADRPRRPALVGPPGLPHRGLRPDARAADQERRDRARGRQGRLLHQARRRRRAPLRHVHPLAAVASPTTSSTARSCSRRACARATATTPTSWSPPTRARRRSRDTANRVSHEYGFWLDDAFASGGSAGYDHKALGITAKGAWESVKRHFKELGVDTQADEFTVVGIGDMSGDVFGNGMLLSRADPARRRLRPPARLHRPRPRRRRSASPSASGCSSCRARRWDDYDRELISEGGGVYPRTAKSIQLVAAGARGARRSRRSRSPPTDVIRAILRAPVDLLWNGGIGTRRQGLDRDRRRRARPRVRRHPRRRRRAAREGRGGGRQPRLHAPRARRVRRRRRAHQRRLHRQLGRRRLLRPRGQPEDPARPGRARAAS